MVHINDLPNKILEHVFGYLSFYSRCNVRLVCRKWDSVSFSASFRTRKVVLAANRNLDLTILLQRTYSNVSIRFDGVFPNKSLENLHVLPSVVPSPKSVRLYVSQCRHLNYVEPVIDFGIVETLYLSGKMNSTTVEQAFQLQMDRLCSLYLDVFDIGNVRFRMPNLRHLNMVVHSQEDLDLLREFINQLHSLTVWFRVPYNFYHFGMTNLRHLSFNITQEDLTESERNIITLLKHCAQLERLELAAKSIGRCVLESIAANLPWLIELTVQASEGAIYVKPFAKLPRLERLRIVGCHVSLDRVHLPSLLSLALCAENLEQGIFVEATEWFMGFPRLQRLTLMGQMTLPNILNSIIVQLPKLRWLRISRCCLVYLWQMDELKAYHPGLAIAFD
ncbi:AGAP012159-PA-like protein [Anopheles sinensis]|uniref:AGAP012159-PA-like protein n=1 Tax=Anopheles sinensis TaxID=74873 RepID=A0A084WB31_ANOSI|nr:AGAP012159-PA-like protein [Anopheles sinensis]